MDYYYYMNGIPFLSVNHAKEAMMVRAEEFFRQGEHPNRIRRFAVWTWESKIILEVEADATSVRWISK